MTNNIENRPDRINWLSLLSYTLKKERKLSWHIHVATHLLEKNKYTQRERREGGGGGGGRGGRQRVESEKESRQPFRTGFDTHQRLFEQELKSYFFFQSKIKWSLSPCETKQNGALAHIESPIIKHGKWTPMLCSSSNQPVCLSACQSDNDCQSRIISETCIHP